MLRLSKCRRILREGCQLYKKKGDKLSLDKRRQFEELLEKLDQSVLAKDRPHASDFAIRTQSFIKSNFPKTFFHHAKELIGALLFAIIFAFLIRDLWFELYEVPTGSMRPTIEEKDRLLVSKTRFGLHFPFQKGLSFFNLKYLKRAEAIVLTVEGMDVADSDAVYFYIFPGKKRFVKRCMGKPGDTVYFYGGLVYGIDKEGNPILELADTDYLKSIGIERIDHIPYITFEGRVDTQAPIARGIYSEALFTQMGIPFANIKFNNDNKKVDATFFDGRSWRKEDLASSRMVHPQPLALSDLWGIGNYSMARILAWRDIESFYPNEVKNGEFQRNDQAPLYLELHHTPNLSSPKPTLQQGETGKVYPTISTQVSMIPLEKTHLETLQNALITARFYVQNGRAFRYHELNIRPQPLQFDPSFPGVPDGCYEFYYGKGYSVRTGGILTSLNSNHPLYDRSPENIKKLFNLGMSFNTLFTPSSPNQPFMPQRFAYFRNGDLYLMGAPIIKKGDPILETYNKLELERERHSTSELPYIAFIDHGPPMRGGKLDVDFIRAFGLKIPNDGVLALGDNYAMSADSRDFGFVPVQNLRGAPSFIFWPPTRRLGALPQPTAPWFTLPNMIVWGSAILVALAWFAYIQNRNSKPQFKKKDS